VGSQPCPPEALNSCPDKSSPETLPVPLYLERPFGASIKCKYSLMTFGDRGSSMKIPNSAAGEKWAGCPFPRNQLSLSAFHASGSGPSSSGVDLAGIMGDAWSHHAEGLVRSERCLYLLTPSSFLAHS